LRIPCGNNFPQFTVPQYGFKNPVIPVKRTQIYSYQSTCKLCVCFYYLGPSPNLVWNRSPTWKLSQSLTNCWQP